MKTNVEKPSQKLPTRALWPALLGLFFFAITFRSSTGAYLVGMVVLLAWLVKADKSRIPALPKPLIAASKVYAVVLCVHMLWTVAANEYSLYETIEGYLHYAELLLFIPFSAVLYHCRAYWLHLLWVPVLAVVVRVLQHTDFSSLDTTLFNKWIYGFGQHHVPFGMQAMLAIIVVMALTRAVVSAFSSKASRWTAAAIAVFAAALLMQALMTSGSRLGWGALLAGIATLAFCNRKYIVAINLKSKIITAIALLLLVTPLVSQNFEKLERRLAHDTQVDFNFTLSIEDLPRDYDVFFARRVHLAYFGWQQWGERPMLGHGPASVRPMLASDPDFNIHPHLHNTYIQVLMELGLIGSSALVVVMAVLFYFFWQIRPAPGQQYRPLYNLIAASSVSLALWSIPSFHLHSSDWRFVFVWYTAFAGFLVREAYAAKYPETPKNTP